MFYVVLAHWLAIPQVVAMVVTVAIVFVIRAAALRFGIPAPTALDLPATITKVRSRVGDRRSDGSGKKRASTKRRRGR